MIRTFYPVGHGAFYRERFVLEDDSIINMVYDCGARTRAGRNKISNVIKKWDRNSINILFISHFHEDHISNLEELINNVTFDYVVLPYLTDLDKSHIKISILRKNLEKKRINYSLIEECFSLIDNIEDILKNKVEQVLYIVKNDEKRIDYVNDRIKYIDDGDLNKYLSKIDNNFSWMFYTFVNSSDSRDRIVNEFNNEFGKIDIYNSFNKIKEIYTKDNKSKLARIYGNNKNEKSLVLYSGPIDHDYYQYVKRNKNCGCINNAGCLYTGDYNANSKYYSELEKHYKDYYKYIGLLQLPHHGSDRNFKNEFLKLNCIYVVCASDNDKKHPSKDVLYKILTNNKCLLIVTEKTKKLQLIIEKTNNRLVFNRSFCSINGCYFCDCYLD